MGRRDAAGARFARVKSGRERAVMEAATMAETVTLGFVGTGGIARHHLEQLAGLEGVRIGAVCDVVEERARATAEKFGGTVYGDYARMLENEKLDGLYVCVPPAMHRPS